MRKPTDILSLHHKKDAIASVRKGFKETACIEFGFRSKHNMYTHAKTFIHTKSQLCIERRKKLVKLIIVFLFHD